LLEIIVINELTLLLEKVRTSEDLLHRAEAFYLEHVDEWSTDFATYFKDMLERKRDQVYYEWYRVGQMGDAVAAGRDMRRIDI
jgi:hypothetical protein